VSNKEGFTEIDYKESMMCLLFAMAKFEW